MNTQQAIEFIFNTNGRFFGVRFIKRTNGQLREMVCRIGVAKGVKGSGQSFDPDAKGLITVWDTTEQGFRMIPVENLIALKCGGDWIEVTHEPCKLVA